MVIPTHNYKIYMAIGKKDIHTTRLAAALVVQSGDGLHLIYRHGTVHI